MVNIISSLESKLTDLTEAIITPENMQILAKSLVKIHSYDFDIFSINSIIDKKTMQLISQEILSKYDFFRNILDERIFKNFVQEINDGYSRSVTYHNDLHGTDVMQTVYILIEKGDLKRVSHIHFNS